MQVTHSCWLWFQAGYGMSVQVLEVEQAAKLQVAGDAVLPDWPMYASGYLYMLICAGHGTSGLH